MVSSPPSEDYPPQPPETPSPQPPAPYPQQPGVYPQPPAPYPQQAGVYPQPPAPYPQQPGVYPQQPGMYGVQQPGVYMPPVVMPGMMGVSPKSRTTAALLVFFLGGLGVHRFYLGLVGTGVVQLILEILGLATSWIYGIGLIFLVPLSIWVLVDIILILTGNMKDGAGLRVLNW